ncbi:DegT/DnrJ/EryC1/StrS family aminotransferase [uncultured Gimesia sp.]|uniref:DegT/DnrJ/EryC1/StrS family aminotransferase n=1 Tax=uncultured Gimesia sp. TaxID=1678688 RepID=UPI002637258C|nr:DegT/DnrJ/EryC1/StrS family aminotransferase [uncultured Gimesia sp.]
MKSEERVIQVFGSHLGLEELEEIRDCLESQWIGLGPKTARLESALACHLGVDDFVLLNSGSNALQMAVHLLDLPEGAEVILPSFTWVACASAVMLCGLKPVFCDVDPATMNLTAASVERVMSPRTAAIMAIHYAGLPAPVYDLAQFGLPIIEDAAHAIDSRVAGRACGTIGDIGIYSFDSVKNLAMGEGGGLVAKDPARLERARKLRLCGISRTGFDASQRQERWWEHEIHEPFAKMTPNDLSAAVGLAQLRKLPAAQARRAAIWTLYQRELHDISWLQTPCDTLAEDRHSFFTYCVQLRGGGRDQLARHLLNRKIYTTLRFHPLHLSPVYQGNTSLTVTEDLMARAINLPLHPRLSDADLGRIIETIRAFRG